MRKGSSRNWRTSERLLMSSSMIFIGFHPLIYVCFGYALSGAAARQRRKAAADIPPAQAFQQGATCQPGPHKAGAVTIAGAGCVQRLYRDSWGIYDATLLAGI